MLNELGIRREDFHAFRHGRCSLLVRSHLHSAIMREWLGHGTDAMIDRYSNRIGEFDKAEMATLNPKLDSSWIQIQNKESGASPQAVVN